MSIFSPSCSWKSIPSISFAKSYFSIVFHTKSKMSISFQVTLDDLWLVASSICAFGNSMGKVWSSQLVSWPFRKHFQILDKVFTVMKRHSKVNLDSIWFVRILKWSTLFWKISKHKRKAKWTQSMRSWRTSLSLSCLLDLFKTPWSLLVMMATYTFGNTSASFVESLLTKGQYLLWIAIRNWASWHQVESKASSSSGVSLLNLAQISSPWIS